MSVAAAHGAGMDAPAGMRSVARSDRARVVRAIAIRAAACLLFGVVVNVLVAWGIVLWMPGLPMAKDSQAIAADHDDADWLYTVPLRADAEGLVIRMRDWSGAVLMLPDEPPRVLSMHKYVDAVKTFEATHPERLRSIETAALNRSVWSLEAGWPRKSLRAHGEANVVTWHSHMADTPVPAVPSDLVPSRSCVALCVPDCAFATRLGVTETPSFGVKTGSPYRPLPIVPLWRGFAINSLVFALMLFAPLMLVPALRSVRRGRRGRCLECGYDLAGLAKCPECGTERMSARTDGASGSTGTTKEGNP